MLAMREILRRKLQFALVTAVVALISYLVLMVTGLGLGLYELAGTALLNLRADAIVYSRGADLSVLRSELGGDAIAEVTGRPGVEEWAPLGYSAAAIQDASGKVTTAAVIGYVPGGIGEPDTVEGRTLEDGETRAMLVDRGFLDASGLRVGDRVRVPARLQLLEFEIVGVIDEGNFFFQPAAYVLQEAWADLRYGVVDEFTPEASIVLLQGDNLAGLEGAGGGGWVTVSKQVAFDNIEGVAAQQSTVDAIRYMGLVIGAMVVGIFFYVITLQKIGQLGMLKAIGAPGLYLARQGMTQVLVVTLVASVIAVGLAAATGWALTSSAAEVPVRFTTRALVTTGASIVVAGVLGAGFSVRQVGRVDPLIALQQQQQ
jgi:putative ABC transport system permease protein